MADALKGQELLAAGRQLDWKSVASRFHIVSARHILAMEKMERHQDIRGKVPWLACEGQPLCLLFISHRWESPDHPDPKGRHLRALQGLLRRIGICVEAVLNPLEERLQLVPSLAYEGTLQAEEISRRMFGFGPFSDGPACVKGGDAKRMVREAWELHRNNRPAFRDWLSGRIGVWLDFTCMPQKPLAPEEEEEFRNTLGMLDSLVISCTLVAFRDASDDYSARGWCASEFFLGSEHSFARNLFVDTGRLERAEEILIPHPPKPSGAGVPGTQKIMADSYEMDLTAFRDACGQWGSFEGPLIEASPPAAWAAYRDLQGSSFFAAEFDPNPLRLALETIRAMETSLIEKWLMADKQHVYDLGKEIEAFMQRAGLRCALPSDMIYLGFLLACHGWVDAFRPLFRECLRRYLEKMRGNPNGKDADSFPKLLVTLKPLAEKVRALFSEVRPSSPGTWNSRLSTGPGPNPRERAVVEQVRESLNQTPPEFMFVNIDEARFFHESIDGLT